MPSRCATEATPPGAVIWHAHCACFRPNFEALDRRSATYGATMLSCAEADDPPIERSTKFELTLNRQTAKALGITPLSHCCCARPR